MTYESIQRIKDAEDYMIGVGNSQTRAIANYFRRNPIYLWFYDNLTARVDTPIQSFVPDFTWFNIKKNLCTGLWLRGRIVTAVGRLIGMPDSPVKLAFAVQVSKDKISKIDFSDKCY